MLLLLLAGYGVAGPVVDTRGRAYTSDGARSGAGDALTLLGLTGAGDGRISTGGNTNAARGSSGNTNAARGGGGAGDE